jgi:hypothetical protein
MSEHRATSFGMPGRLRRNPHPNDVKDVLAQVNSVDRRASRCIANHVSSSSDRCPRLGREDGADHPINGDARCQARGCRSCTFRVRVERRACRMIGCVRMTVRYRSRRPADTELRERLRALAHERRRFGYRRLQVLLRREGFIVNHKRLFRIYCGERLLVRRRGGRKRALGTRAPMLIPEWPNRPLVARFCCRPVHRWAPFAHPRRARRLHARVPGARRW